MGDRARAGCVEGCVGCFGRVFAVVFGVEPRAVGHGIPTATWGGILNEAQSITVIETMPWLWIPPGALIALTVLSINFAGDGLRDALDPRLIDLTKSDV